MILLVGINFGAKVLEQYAGILVTKQFVLSLKIVKMLNEKFCSEIINYNNV